MCVLFQSLLCLNNFRKFETILKKNRQIWIKCLHLGDGRRSDNNELSWIYVDWIFWYKNHLDEQVISKAASIVAEINEGSGVWDDVWALLILIWMIVDALMTHANISKQEHSNFATSPSSIEHSLNRRTKHTSTLWCGCYCEMFCIYF